MLRCLRVHAAKPSMRSVAHNDGYSRGAAFASQSARVSRPEGAGVLAPESAHDKDAQKPADLHLNLPSGVVGVRWRSVSSPSRVLGVPLIVCSSRSSQAVTHPSVVPHRCSSVLCSNGNRCVQHGWLPILSQRQNLDETG